MQKNFLLLLLLCSSAAKTAPKFKANGMRIFLEEAGKIGDSRFSRLMLLCQKFNGAAQNLTHQKSPFSFVDLASFFAWDFRQGDIKKFNQMKEMILHSWRIKKHMSFKNVLTEDLQHIAQILNHPPVKENLQKLIIETEQPFTLNPVYNTQSFFITSPLKEALKNLLQLKALSFMRADFRGQDIPIPKNLKSLDLSYCKNIPASFWQTIQAHFKKENMGHKNQSDFFSNPLKALSISGICEIPHSFWDGLGQLHLESLNFSETNFKGIYAHDADFASHLKVLNLFACRDISDWGFMSHLKQIEDLDVSYTSFNMENIKLSPTLQHLKMRHCSNVKQEFLESLEKLNKLQTLDLSAINFSHEKTFLNLCVDPKDQKIILENKKVFFPTSLKLLNLSECSNINPETLQGIERLIHLETLTLPGKALENEKIFFPLSLKSLEIRESFHYFYNKERFKINPQILEAIQRLINLETLALAGADLEYRKAFFPKSLKILSILGCTHTTETLEGLAYLNQLQTLNLAELDFEHKNTSFPRSLKVLDLSRSRNINAYTLDTIQHLNDLETLNCYQVSLKNHRFVLPQKLQSLDLVSCKNESHELGDVLTNLDKLKNLKKANIAYTDFSLNQTILPYALKELNLSKCLRISSDFFCNLSKLTHLEKLDISYIDFSEKEGGPLPFSLKYLNMRYFKCSLDFWKNLANLPLLEELDVSCTNFKGKTSSIVVPGKTRCYIGETLVFQNLKVLSSGKCLHLAVDFLKKIKKSSVKIMKRD